MPPQPIKTHLPSIAQLILSVAGLVTSLASALALWLMLKVSSTIQPMIGENSTQFSTSLWVVIVISLLAIPSLVLSVRRLARLPLKKFRTGALLAASIAFLVVLALLFLAYKLPDLFNANLWFNLLSLAAVMIPLWWFVELGQRKLQSGSPQRFWGLINFEIFAGMPLVAGIEILLIMLIVVIGGVRLLGQTELTSLWMTLQTQLMINPQDLTVLQNQITEMVQKPGFISIGFLILVVIVPLIEEALKPLALWFFIKEDWSPADGFCAGLVCGASFALVESLSAVAAIPQENWLITVIARIGTGLLHTLTAGISGWALTSAWKNKKFLRLGIVYLASVLIHGTWNFFAVLFDLNTNLSAIQIIENSAFLAISPWVLGLLFIAMLLALYVFNRKLCRSDVPPPISPLPTDSIG